MTQPSTAEAAPGSSITLDCEVSGYNINDHHLSWVRQAMGGKLVYIASFRTGYTTYIANEFKGRVIPTTSGSTAKLTINALATTDTAMYYCARSTVTQDELFFVQYLGSCRNILLSSFYGCVLSFSPFIYCLEDGLTNSNGWWFTIGL